LVAFVATCALVATFSPFTAMAATPDVAESAYGELRAATLAGWTVDGSLFIRTRFGASEQLHRVTQPLGMREQLTFGRDAVAGAAASPVDANRVILLQAHAGERHPSLVLRQLDDGSSRRFGDGRQRQDLPRWAHDGRQFAFTMEPREGGRREVYVADTGSSAPPRRVAQRDEQDLAVLDWSYDDAKLLLRGHATPTDQRLYVLDLRSGALTQFEPAAAPPPARPRRQRGRFAAAPAAAPVQARTLIGDARFSRDGRGVYFVTTRDAQFAGLHYADLFTHEHRLIAPQDHAAIDHMALSRDGRHVAYTLNEAGYSRLVVHDLAQRVDLLLPPVPAGSLIRDIAFDPEGRRLALSVESAVAARDVFVLQLEGTPQLTRWTRSEAQVPGIAAPVAPQPIRFATWDRVDTRFREIPAFLYLPRSPGPHPVLIDLHAGFEAPYRPGWDPATQFAVNELGYAVIAPDLRGTPGHGTDFIELGTGRLRDDALRDVGALLVWVGLRTDLDRNQVRLRTDAAGATLGRAALAMYGDRIKAFDTPLQ
jgi:dipeptidyl aminopeptidase/acylaminoacyl peptidase